VVASGAAIGASGDGAARGAGTVTDIERRKQNMVRSPHGANRRRAAMAGRPVRAGARLRTRARR